MTNNYLFRHKPMGRGRVFDYPFDISLKMSANYRKIKSNRVRRTMSIKSKVDFRRVTLNAVGKLHKDSLNSLRNTGNLFVGKISSNDPNNYLFLDTHKKTGKSIKNVSIVLGTVNVK